MSMQDLLFDKSGAKVTDITMQEMLNGRNGMVDERLPFTVRVVRSEEQLGKAVSIRHSAYARHVPAVAALLSQAEILDRDSGSVVLLAESKLDGSPLGTMRIQTNRHRKLALEQTVELPDWLKGKTLAEATRLGVAEGRIGRVVKTTLFKAYYQYCLAKDIEWMVIAARSPWIGNTRRFSSTTFSRLASLSRCATPATSHTGYWHSMSPRRRTVGRKPIIRCCTTCAASAMPTSILRRRISSYGRMNPGATILRMFSLDRLENLP